MISTSKLLRLKWDLEGPALPARDRPISDAQHLKWLCVNAIEILLVTGGWAAFASERRQRTLYELPDGRGHRGVHVPAD